MSSASRALYIILLVAVPFGSFFITLWLTEPDTTGGTSPIVADNRPIPERLAAHRASNLSQLSDVARDVGLRLSRTIKGSVDDLNRINGRDVSMQDGLLIRKGHRLR